MTEKWIENAIDEELDGRKPKDQEIADLKALVVAKDAALDHLLGEITRIIENYGTALAGEWNYQLMLDDLRRLLPRGQ